MATEAAAGALVGIGMIFLILFLIFFIAIFALAILSFVFWIMMLIDSIKRKYKNDILRTLKGAVSKSQSTDERGSMVFLLMQNIGDSEIQISKSYRGDKLAFAPKMSSWIS